MKGRFPSIGQIDGGEYSTRRVSFRDRGFTAVIGQNPCVVSDGSVVAAM